MTALTIITAPTETPVTIEELKSHCRVNFDDDDAMLEIYLNAATQHCEEYTGRAFCLQTLELALDAFPCNEIRLPRPPLVDVLSVTYDDSDGVPTVMVSGTDYDVDNRSRFGWVILRDGTSWPTPYVGINVVRVRYRAGYSSADSPPVANLPSDIKAAVMLTAATLYNNRENMVIGTSAQLLPFSAKTLLQPHRVHTGMA